MSEHITSTQVLKWHDASKDIPEMNRVVLIKVPDEPWIFHGKGGYQTGRRIPRRSTGGR